MKGTGRQDPEGGTPRALPRVAGRAGNNAVWVFGIVLAVVAAALFYSLEMRRSALSSPNLTVPERGQGTISSPPELAIPSPFAEDVRYPMTIAPLPPSDEGFRLPRDEPVPVRTVRRPAPRQIVEEEPAADDPPPPRRISRPRPPEQDERPVVRQFEPPPLLGDPSDAERKTLKVLANPGNTIAKGTVIHAVLESALDSTRPGGVRAIVSRNVSSFDGSRVLIPKGSRLIGSYEADLARGHKRALVTWSRLMLPGGMMMELDSPSADPLGRAGIEGKVDSHFFARFGDALMRSVLDTGVQLAGREIGGGTVIVNLPNSGQLAEPNTIQPTLEVRHGTSVSVFVAHDLDFSALPS